MIFRKIPHQSVYRKQDAHGTHVGFVGRYQVPSLDDIINHIDTHHMLPKTSDLLSVRDTKDVLMSELYDQLYQPGMNFQLIGYFFHKDCFLPTVPSDTVSLIPCLLKQSQYHCIVHTTCDGSSPLDILEISVLLRNHIGISSSHRVELSHLPDIYAIHCGELLGQASHRIDFNNRQRHEMSVFVVDLLKTMTATQSSPPMLYSAFVGQPYRLH